MDFYLISFDIYGPIGPGAERGLQRIANFMSFRRGTCPLKERTRLLTVLSSLVLQRTALAINRRKLDRFSASS